MTHVRRGLLLLSLLALVFASVPVTAQARPSSRAPGQEAPKPEAAKPDPILTLKIGDPKLKDKVLEVAPGAVLSARAAPSPSTA